MRGLVLGLLLACCAMAEPRRVMLMQELMRVEAMERKTVLLFPLAQQGAQLEVKFTSRQEGEGVRMAVFAGGSNQPLASTKYNIFDTLRAPLEREREYRVEIENQRQRLGHALVDVEVTLVFGGRPEAAATSAVQVLDPRRKFVTILASLALFGLIVGYSAIRLTSPVLARWRGER